MKIFVAHPIRGDIEGNCEKVREICRTIVTKLGHIPIAPYLGTLQYLNEKDAFERRRGIEIGLEHLPLADELWLFGNRVSTGMLEEIIEAKRLGIPIRAMTEETEAYLGKPIS